MSAVKENLIKCKAILNTKYRWIGLLTTIIWSLLMPLIISATGAGIYFAIFTAILLINAFFTIDTCMRTKNLFFALLPYILPIFGFIAITIYSSVDGLQLLAGLSPEMAEKASEDINWILGQGFVEVVGHGAPNIAWASFLPLYIIGFVVYAWADSSDRDSLKGIATIVLISPIAIQFILGFTYGKSYGLLGSIAGIGEVLGYLGSVAGIVAVIIGSVLDFILVSILFGIEHAIVEEEEL